MLALKLTRAAAILGLALLTVFANSSHSAAQEKPTISPWCSSA